MVTYKKLEQIPKIELHVHLEGSVQPDTLLMLAEKNKVPMPANSLEEIKSWYRYEDFNSFIQVYLKICECISSAEDIEFIAREFLKNQKEQNIIYTEITYTPYTHYIQYNIPIADQIAALGNARKWAEEKLDISCNFIFDISRNVSPKEGLVTAKWLMDNEADFRIALGLGGPEKDFPPEIHREAFRLIKDAGIPSLPHAGETAGPESVWGAIKHLNADRIGHGVRSIEDPGLIDYIVENDITLEVCPSSNICLGVYENINDHPLPLLVERGVKVTINSDDPPMFNTSLVNEYKTITEIFNYKLDDLYQFNMNAIDSSIPDKGEKESLFVKYNRLWNNEIE